MKKAGGLSYLIATGAYSGLSPAAPGTVGSIAATIVWVFASKTIAPTVSEHLLSCLLLFIVAILSTASVLESTPEEKDPGKIVIDEWAGMWIALSAARPLLLDCLLAFLLFRLFDITKPFVVRKLESLPGAWGVVLDDIAAGGLALIVFIAVKSLVPL